MNLDSRNILVQNKCPNCGGGLLRTANASLRCEFCNSEFQINSKRPGVCQICHNHVNEENVLTVGHIISDEIAGDYCNIIVCDKCASSIRVDLQRHVQLYNRMYPPVLKKYFTWFQLNIAIVITLVVFWIVIKVSTQMIALPIIALIIMGILIYKQKANIQNHGIEYGRYVKQREEVLKQIRHQLGKITK